MADRLDTLVGIFGIGEPPTGSKDPFALRRASLAVIRMLINLEKPLSLTELLQAVVEQHTAELSPDTPDVVSHYITERLGNWYDDDGINISVVRAALAAGATDLFDIDLRVRALNAFAKTETAEHLAQPISESPIFWRKPTTLTAHPPTPTSSFMRRSTHCTRRLAVSGRH